MLNKKNIAQLQGAHAGQPFRSHLPKVFQITVRFEVKLRVFGHEGVNDIQQLVGLSARECRLQNNVSKFKLGLRPKWFPGVGVSKGRGRRFRRVIVAKHINALLWVLATSGVVGCSEIIEYWAWGRLHLRGS